MMKAVGFAAAWCLNVIYLIVALVVLGQAEKALGIFDGGENAMVVLLLFLGANLAIVYVTFRNCIYPRYFFLQGEKKRLSGSRTALWLSVAAIVLLALKFNP